MDPLLQGQKMAHWLGSWVSCLSGGYNLHLQFSDARSRCTSTSSDNTHYSYPVGRGGGGVYVVVFQQMVEILWYDT